MAEIGLGSAIGLQGVPKDYTSLVAQNIARQAQQQAAQQKAQAEAAARAQDEYSKYLDKIQVDPSKYANVLIPQAKQATANFLDIVKNERRNNPNGWQNSDAIRKAKLETDAYLGKLQNDTKSGNEMAELAIKNPQGYNVDQVGFDIWTKGTPEQYAAYQNAQGTDGVPTFIGEKPVNWFDDVNKMEAPFKKSESASELGEYGATVFNEEASKEKADLFLKNGEPKKVESLLKQAASKFKDNADFKILDQEAQQQKIYEEAKQMFADLQRTNFNPSSHSDTRIKGNSAYTGNGNKFENNNWAFDYYTDNDKGADLINIAQKNVGDTKPYTFKVIGGGIETGIPRAFKKVSFINPDTQKPEATWQMKLEVPQYMDVEDGEGGTKRVRVPGSSKTEWVNYDGVREFATETGISPVEMEQKIDKKGSTVQQKNQPQNTVERVTKDGKIAIFDANTKKFLRYK